MSKYYNEVSGVERDELQAGTAYPVDVWNVNVGASAVIERGMLLAANGLTGTWSQVAASTDATKIMGIATTDFTADADHTVTQVYAGGTFNREKIILGGASTLTVDVFEPELRKQNIHLRHLRAVD